MNVKFFESDPGDHDSSGAALGPSSNTLIDSRAETGCEDEREIQYGSTYPLTQVSFEEIEEEGTSDGQNDGIPLRSIT